MAAANEEDNAQTSADKAMLSDSCFNLKEDDCKATQKPEDEEDEKRDGDGKSKPPQYKSAPPPASTNDLAGKQLQFPVTPESDCRKDSTKGASSPKVDQPDNMVAMEDKCAQDGVAVEDEHAQVIVEGQLVLMVMAQMDLHDYHSPPPPHP